MTSANVRSDDAALLKRLQTMPLVLERPLKGKAEITLNAYSSVQVRDQQNENEIHYTLCIPTIETRWGEAVCSTYKITVSV